jgi:hypothetical protein
VLQAAALRAVQHGHDIGSHAAQHLDLTKLNPAEIEQQIAWGSRNISSLTGSSIVPVSTRACRTHMCIDSSAVRCLMQVKQRLTSPLMQVKQRLTSPLMQAKQRLTSPLMQAKQRLTSPLKIWFLVLMLAALQSAHHDVEAMHCSMTDIRLMHSCGAGIIAADEAAETAVALQCCAAVQSSLRCWLLERRQGLQQHCSISLECGALDAHPRLLVSRAEL